MSHQLAITGRTKKRQISESPPKDEEKTIPFLRRLTDMLQENEDVISFYPGDRMNGQVTAGRIVVHDRAIVESEILPRYFNHASFASLRRQLNYFAFCRVGKGRQRGATYCNDQVVELQDILRLKRRVVGNTVTNTNKEKELTPKEDFNEKRSRKESQSSQISSHCQYSQRNELDIPSSKSTLAYDQKFHDTTKKISDTQYRKGDRSMINSIVPVVHLPPTKKRSGIPISELGKYKSDSITPKVEISEHLSITVSPPPTENDNFLIQKTKTRSQRTSMDLTLPTTKKEISLTTQGITSPLTIPACNVKLATPKIGDSHGKSETLKSLGSNSHCQSGMSGVNFVSQSLSLPVPQTLDKDADVLAGCNALLALGVGKSNK